MRESTLSSPSAAFTEIALPFPRPPTSELANKLVSSTIQARPDLFQIVTPLNLLRIKQMLSTHPNRPFVDSLCLSLQEGSGHGPIRVGSPQISHGTIVDHEYGPMRNANSSWQHVVRRRKPAVFAGLRHGSAPGMVCGPVFPVPKPGNTNQLRLVTDQSAGLHSLNSLIPDDNRSVRFDNLHDLGSALRDFHRHHGRGPRWLFKSDVSKAYRLLPMHPHWQIRQVLEEPKDGEMQKR